MTCAFPLVPAGLIILDPYNMYKNQNLIYLTAQTEPWLDYWQLHNIRFNFMHSLK